MKKLSIILASAVAAFSFSSCNKQEINNIPTSNEISFSINANIDETTKTTLDPNTYEVAWENGDILYVVTADETWGQAYKSDNDGNTIKDFTYNSGTKLFTSDATIAPGTYTFRAAYSRADQRPYHRGASTTAKILATQTQNCTAPTAHIKDNDYLYGVAEATIEAESTPTLNFNMTHVGVLMQVNFTNNTGAEVELTKMEMILESGDLYGIFNINYDVSGIKLGDVNGSQPHGSTITLNVSNGTVANGASLPLYFVMAPIADYSGDVTFRFTDSASNTYTVKKEKSGLTFAANTYNTASLAFDEADAALEGGYKKVASEPADWSGTYLIVDENGWRVFNGVDGTNAYVSATEPVDGVIAATSALEACEVLITPMTDGYSIKVMGGTNAGKYIYGTTGKNALNFGNTATLNTIEYSAGGVTIKGVASGTVNVSLRYNATSGQNRFRYYKDATTGDLYHFPHLYKKM